MMVPLYSIRTRSRCLQHLKSINRALIHSRHEACLASHHHVLVRPVADRVSHHPDLLPSA